MKDFKTRW